MSYQNGRFKIYNESAIYSCKHKITGATVCAVPCDGQDELCEDALDEKCEGPGILMTTMAILLLSLTFASSSSLLSYFRLKKRSTLANVVAVELRHLGNKNHLKPHREPTKLDGNYLYIRLSLCKSKMDVRKAVELTTDVYRKILFNSSCVQDWHIMRALDTNDLTAYFYDCKDRSLFVKLNLWLHVKLQRIFTLMRNFYIGAVIIMMKGTVITCLRYSDLCKDLLFLYVLWLQLGQYENDAFPMVVFQILAISLIVTEVGNIIMVLNSDVKGAWWRRVLVIASAPLMPAYYIYEVLHLELSKFTMLHRFEKVQESSNMKTMSKKLKYIDGKIWTLQMKLAKLQYNENVFENLPQLTILVIISLLNRTYSPGVVTMENIFMDDKSYLGPVLRRGH